MPNFSVLADVIESLCIYLGDALVLEKWIPSKFRRYQWL